jgi:hypothetical protein
MKKILLLLFMFAGFSVFGQLSENFEGTTFPPTGWITFETGTGAGQSWSETNLAVFTYGGVGKSAVINKENVATGQAIDWMVTSAVTVPANGQLRFYTKTSQTGVQGSLFNIKISTTSQTNPASFTNLIAWDEASLTATANVYEEKVIDIPATYPVGSTIYIAFVMTNDNGDRWLVDNVNVVQKCNSPIGPLSTALETTTSAQLSWGNPGGITAWQVEVVPFADPFTGVATYTNVTTNPFIATGLLPNTLYKFQVRSVCANGFASDWFVPSSFQTASFGDTCSGPIVVGTLPYQTVDNTANYLDLFDTAQPLSCSGSAINYMAGNDVFYSYTATFTGNIAISLSPTNVSSSIHVYSACPGTAGTTCLAGVANTTSGVRNINPFAVVAGTTYYIIISSSAAQQTVGYTLTIQQVFCYQPNAGTDGETTICETSTAPIDLFSLITGEQSGGVWTQTSGYGGVFSATAGTFTPAMGATNSTFAYTLSGTFPCIDDSSLATVNIIAQPNAGTDGGTNICETSTATIDLFSLITGEQSGGVWTQTSGSGGVFNSVLGTFTPAIGAITSTFTYTISGTLPCIDDSSLATVNINAQPNTESIAYGTPFCSNNATAQSVTFSGTSAAYTGGVFSSAIGLSINSSTGAITPSSSTPGTYTVTYTIPPSGGCPSTQTTTTVTILPLNTVTVTSLENLAHCINSILMPITYTTTGATGIASTTTNYGLPSGVNASWAANTITISGSPTESGVFNYSIPLTGGCGNVNATGAITVNPSNTVTAPSASPTLCYNTILTPITHTTTGATGIGTATGLPSGVTTAWSANTITISGTPVVAGAFNYTIPLTGGCGTVNATATGTIIVSGDSPSSISADGTTATSVSINNGNTVQLQLNGFFGSPSNIQWTPNIGISSTTISNPIVYPSTTTTYTASFINSNGCLQSTSITVNVNPLPNIGNISISTTNNPVVGLFDTITVNVQLTNATDLYSLYMKLKGNAAVSQYLDYSGYVASTLLGPLADVIATNPVVTNGEYDFGITKIGAVPGYTGSGLFYTFKFVTKNIPIPDGTVFCFYLDDVNTYNSTGSACGLTNQGQYCFTFTNQIKVWPGDLNNSNVVTTADLLPIGYFYNSTGPVRPNATIQWSGQPATLWGYNHSFLNSNAYKTFADSNGDGVINNADQAAIGFNMNQVHARLASDKPFGIAPNTSNNAQVQGALNVTPNVSIINGAVLPQTVTFTVNLTNTGGLSSLYGISVNLIFDNTIFDLSTATINYTGSIFGNVGTDCLAMNYNSASGVSVGLTRYANAAINGQGLLFKVTLQTKTTLPNLAQTQVTSYVDAANNQLGNPLEIGDSTPINFSVINVNLSLNDIVLNTFKLYPNPSKGILYFSVGDSYLDFQELKLKIVNTLGQVIDQISVKNSTEEIITKNWGSSGLYFVQIETTQGEILGIKKIILQ